MILKIFDFRFFSQHFQNPKKMSKKMTIFNFPKSKIFIFFNIFFGILKMLRKKSKIENFQNHFSPRKKLFCSNIFLMINLYKYFTRVDFYDSCGKMAQMAGGSVSDTLFFTDNLRNFWFFGDFFRHFEHRKTIFWKTKIFKIVFLPEDFFFFKKLFFGDQSISKVHPC